MLPLAMLASGRVCLFGNYIHRKYNPAGYALAKEQNYEL